MDDEQRIPLPIPTMINLNLPPLTDIDSYRVPFRLLIRSLRTLSVDNFLPSTRLSSCSRPRPFYNMSPRGPSMLLSPKTITDHLQNGTGENLLRRHECALRAAELLHREWSPHSNMKLKSIPLPLKLLCKHYNDEYLIRHDDLQINAKSLWGILYRRKYAQSDIKEMSHQFLYIQERHLDPDEIKSKTLIRRKPACGNQLGSDFSKIKSNVSIQLPSNRAMFYTVRDLHYRAHGSVASCDIDYRHNIMDSLGIETHVITPFTTNNNTQSSNDIFVAYDGSVIFDELQSKSTVGILGMHHQLTTYLISVMETDSSRAGLKIHPECDSKNQRVRWGLGRKQPEPSDSANCECCHWKLYGNKMPTIAFKAFVKMPKCLQIELVQVFECASKFVKECMPDMFPSKQRKRCTKKLNGLMGFELATMQFEYYDIVITRNTVLPKHIDQKNDHRVGYNFCAVYSYYHIIDGLEYKVSIIMTTRTTLGSALTKLN